MNNRIMYTFILYILLFIIPFIAVYSQDTAGIAPAKKIVLNGKEYYLHVVKKGEGLYRISVDYGVSQREILEANDDITENLKVNQIVRIPIFKGRNSNADEMDESRMYIYHTVEKGQTVFYVSRKYSVSVDVLYENNPGSKNRLVEGAILKIPVAKQEKETAQNTAPDNNFIFHTVQPKETLYALAKQYGTPASKIVEVNPALQNGVLSVGSTVRIPADSGNEKTVVHSSPDGVEQFIKSDDYLYHIILEGQTLYSIARQYQVQVQDLMDANHGITQENLKVGYTLRVPHPVFDSDKMEQIKNSDMFTLHRVTRKETLYGISRTHHVDEKIISEVNPQVDFRNLRSGTRLKIPTDAWFAVRTASVLQTIENSSAAADTLLSGSSLPPVAGCNNPKIGIHTSIKVALLFPFQAKTAIDYYNDSLASPAGRNAAMRTKPFTEFYTGMLMAVEELKKQGASISLTVYDIASDVYAMQKALSDPELKNMDLIIGPGISSELPPVSAFSAGNNIPLVFPMSNDGPDLVNNHYMFQINSPDTLYNDVIADEIVRQTKGENLLIILPSTPESDAANLIANIKQRTFAQSQPDGSYMEYQPGRDDLAGIEALIDTKKHTFIVIPSKKQAEVSRLIPIITGIKTKTKASVTLFGMQEWLRFQTIDPENMHLLNTTIFSPFALDYTNSNTREFIKKYRQWYHTEPHAVNPYFQSSDATAGYSRYGIWGYDVSLYFMTAVGRYGKNFGMCLNSFQCNLIQFNFNFKRISNWGGFYNRGLFMIKFNQDYTTERIALP